MKKILLVEDDFRYGGRIEKVLKRLGYEVRWESKGFYIVPKALEFRPDLIILDLFFDKTDNAHGEDIAGEIRANPLLESVPIVVLTAFMQDKDIETANELYRGALKYYFRKTADPDIILEKIRELVEAEPFSI